MKQGQIVLLSSLLLAGTAQAMPARFYQSILNNLIDKHLMSLRLSYPNIGRLSRYIYVY